MTTTSHPVIVVGAGPTGLAAAAHLRERGLDHVVLEVGEVAAGVRAWGHVRLFSPWAQLVDPAAVRLLERDGWDAPDPDRHPTGREWVEGYLAPLAAALGPAVRTGHRVTAITRLGLDRLAEGGRDTRPLAVHVATADGAGVLLARAVLDASGSTGSPNPLGTAGIPAPGEEAAADRIDRAVPDLTDPATRARHAGRHTLVVGAGHSAQTAVVALGRLADEVPGTTATWVLRRSFDPTRVGGGEADQLRERGALGLAAQRTVTEGRVALVEGFRTAAVHPTREGLALQGEDGRRVEADRVLALTGYRPDLSLERELRLDLHPATEAPRALGPLIDPAHHSCGTVPPHGEADLRHPEPGMYVVGMKSYGRAPTFLALTGFEQVRSVVAHLAGDDAAARRVELSLPETGVCGGTGLDEAAPGEAALPVVGAGGCC